MFLHYVETLTNLYPLNNKSLLTYLLKIDNPEIKIEFQRFTDSVKLGQIVQGQSSEDISPVGTQKSPLLFNITSLYIFKIIQLPTQPRTTAD